MTMPEMNCARKLARYTRSFASSNSASACACRPYTLTMSCPENISSTCPLSLPVHRHCSPKYGCERRAMSRVTTSDSGTVTSEISASSGLMTIIMTSTPTTVANDVMLCVRVCWSVVLTLSMSLVTRLSRSPRACASTYRSGSRPILRSTSSRSA